MKRIMVVDDDPAILFTIRQTLEADGYSVVSATNGREALDLLDRIQLPDMILTDLAMPEMDGREFTARLKQNPILKGIPVVVVSAEKNADVPGAAAMVTKPFNLENLLNVIEAFLR